MNVLGNYLHNYICSSRNSAEITAFALSRSDFRLFLFADNDFSVSFQFLSSTAYRLVITMNHGYMGFSKVDEKSNFVSCEEKKKSQKLSIMQPVKLKDRDFPGGSVAKTPQFQCTGCGFDPWSGN